MISAGNRKNFILSVLKNKKGLRWTGLLVVFVLLVVLAGNVFAFNVKY